MMRRTAILAALVALLAGCSGEPEPRTVSPLVVIGLDGASWEAIHELWDRGELPHLRALAERGASTDLRPVADVSPIIWTSVATGVRPERHGITDFLLPTTAGDVPVSSTDRRVPAIWNMLTKLERRSAVLSWWVTWPAEEIRGVVVSDRALKTADRSVFPADFEPRVREVVAETAPPAEESLQAEIARQDEVMGRLAEGLLQEPFDLLLVYLRSPDVVSHPYWKYFRLPETEAMDAAKIEEFGDRVPEAYRATDRIVGELVAAAPENTNFLVISDHGFTHVEGEEYRMLVDLNVVLEHLGYLEQREGEIDWSATRAVTWNSPPGLPEKMVRIGSSDRQPAGPVAPGEVAKVRDRLAAELAEVVNKNGAPVFHTRMPRAGEIEQGADLVVVVHQRRKARDMFYRGEEIVGVTESVEELTGTHSVETPGIFIAAGPDIDPTFRPRAVHSLDITPTLLFGLGLPVAEDFDGKARVRLFNEEFRASHPLRTIPTWGELGPGEATASEVDEELKKELRALGYID